MILNEKGSAEVLIFFTAVVSIFAIGAIYLYDERCRFFHYCSYIGVVEIQAKQETVRSIIERNEAYEKEKKEQEEKQKEINFNRVNRVVNEILERVMKRASKGGTNVEIWDRLEDVTWSEFHIILETVREKGFRISYRYPYFYVYWH